MQLRILGYNFFFKRLEQETLWINHWQICMRVWLHERKRDTRTHAHTHAQTGLPYMLLTTRLFFRYIFEEQSCDKDVSPRLLE